MSSIPSAKGIDSTLALLRNPYGFIPDTCRDLEGDLFETRILFQKTICMTGAAAAEAETKAKANVAFDFFVEAYGVKWDKAVAKLVRDRDVLLTFYDYPAEHWKHVRTSNPIESTFATVRHRTKRTKGCLSRKTGLAMAFRLMMSAQAKWRKLDGRNRLPEVISGVEFRDGVRQLQAAA